MKKKLQTKINYTTRLCFILCMALTCVLLCLPFKGISQSDVFVIKGKILDGAGKPLPGVTVSVKKTNVATITNDEGDYQIAVPEKQKNATLVFSSVGFAAKELTIGSKRTIDVTLNAETGDLGEVVIVGYGTVKKRDFTGAVTKIKAKDLPMTANPNVATMLQGKAPGLVVLQSSAEPGGNLDLYIRGQANGGAGNRPLYVIDGIPVSEEVSDAGAAGKYGGGFRSPLNSINPNDVESIEILKDASATAIYGSRASNGVIMITTKRGKEGKVTVNYSGYTSVQKVAAGLKSLGKDESRVLYRQFDYENYLVANSIAPYGTNTAPPPYVDRLSLLYPDSTNFTDWSNEVLRKGAINEHNVSLSSGTNTNKLYASFGYFDQKGIIKNSGFKRYTGRINYDAQVTKNLKFSLSTTYSLNDISNIPQLRRNSDGSFLPYQGNEETPLLPLLLTYSPYLAKQNPDGTYPSDPANPILANPLSLLEVSDNSKLQRLFGKAGLRYEIIPGLSLGFDYGYDLQGSVRKNYLPKTTLYGRAIGGQASQASSTGTNKLLSYTVNYQKDLSKRHNINVLIGHDYQEFAYDNFNVVSSGFLTDTYLYNNLASGTNPSATGSNAGGRIYSALFGRLIYKFDNKYVVTATIRRDGASNFADNYKHGIFPSIAVAWQAGEEKFIKNIAAISDLKVRASYGVTGNGNIGNNAFSIYTSSDPFFSSYSFGSGPATGVIQSQTSNPNLRWEKSAQANFGIDFGLFKNKITGTFDIFKKTIDGLLGFRSLSPLSDVAGYTANTGIRTTTGWEFLTSVRAIDKKDLRLIVSANFAHYIDRWKDRQTSAVLAPWEVQNERLGNIYGYKTEGIYRVGDKIPTAMPNIKPGNLIFQDINGFDANGNLTGVPDGIISTADVSAIGNYSPDYSVGLNINLTYKSFDFGVNTYGLLGRESFSSKVLNTTPNGFLTKEAKNVYYATSNTAGNFPGIAPNEYGAGFANDFGIVKASFVRLKNITLGYSLSPALLKKAGISMARFYVDGQNLAVFTNYDGVDPETGYPGQYPLQRTYSFGVNFSF